MSKRLYQDATFIGDSREVTRLFAKICSDTILLWQGVYQLLYEEQVDEY